MWFLKKCGCDAGEAAGGGAHRDDHFNLKLVEELESPRKGPVEKPVRCPWDPLFDIGKEGHQAYVESLAQPGCWEHRGTKEGWAEASGERRLTLMLGAQGCAAVCQKLSWAWQAGPGAAELGNGCHQERAAGLGQEVALLADPPPWQQILVAALSLSASQSLLGEVSLGPLWGQTGHVDRQGMWCPVPEGSRPAPPPHHLPQAA